MASTNGMKMFVNGLLISTAILMFAGFGTAQSSTQDAATREYKRLVNLSAVLRKITGNNHDKEPYRSLLKRNDKDIVYSDPSGEWYVVSRRFWDLEKKYRKLAIADRIAWSAAENPLPGECEGYVPCYLGAIRRTHGEYLKRYPRGRYSKKAVGRMIKSLQYLVDDAASRKKNHDGPAEDDVEFAELINALVGILKPVPHGEKKIALSHLKTIESAYK
ncbi:MAG: hypothetical protein ACKVQW_13695 [Pyrinomonadaceae bacterium]